MKNIPADFLIVKLIQLHIRHGKKVFLTTRITKSLDFITEDYVNSDLHVCDDPGSFIIHETSTRHI